MVYYQDNQKVYDLVLKDNKHSEIPIHYAYVIENFFGSKKAKDILDFTVKYENCFWDGTIIGDNNPHTDKNTRSNKVMYADQVFSHDRKTYPLLRYLDEAFPSAWFRQFVIGKPQPFPQFSTTNIGETQVSRYGDEGQKYDWHIDRITNNNSRIFSFVYYFFKEPKRFTGGNLQLANISDTADGTLISKYKPIITEIEPKNDMAVFFTSTTAHCVTPTTSPHKFEDGRFSVNCWVGIR